MDHHLTNLIIVHTDKNVDRPDITAQWKKNNWSRQKLDSLVKNQTIQC